MIERPSYSQRAPPQGPQLLLRVLLRQTQARLVQKGRLNQPLEVSSKEKGGGCHCTVCVAQGRARNNHVDCINNPNSIGSSTEAHPGAHRGHPHTTPKIAEPLTTVPHRDAAMRCLRRDRVGGTQCTVALPRRAPDRKISNSCVHRPRGGSRFHTHRGRLHAYVLVAGFFHSRGATPAVRTSPSCRYHHRQGWIDNSCVASRSSPFHRAYGVHHEHCWGMLGDAA